MTCIVGLEVLHGVWLGSDSFSGNEGWRSVIDPRRKIVDVADMMVGIAGAWALREVLLTARRPETVNDDELTLFRYASAWRERAVDLGFATTADGATRTPNRGEGHALIAYRGRLWRLQSDWTLTKAPLFEAIGSGGCYAEGALAATEGNMPSEDRMKAALGAAADLCPTVSRPFHVVFQAKP